MANRSVQQVIQASAVSEGAGVTVYRTIGTPALRNLDPFLMLDYFCSDDPDDYIAGFPNHPHRGFNTFTYMLDGHMLHQDSMGNKGDLVSGGAQWMKAGSGVIHSEMPQQSNGLMRGFQLWINLPASEKMSQPSYKDLAPDDIPVLNKEGCQIKVLVGKFEDCMGGYQEDISNILYLDIKLDAGKTFTHGLDSDATCFVYIFEGDAVSDQDDFPEHSFVVLGAGERVSITAGNNGVRMLLVCGDPIKEPIEQYGPFVMNTQAEIHQAMDDYRNDVLVVNKY